MVTRNTFHSERERERERDDDIDDDVAVGKRSNGTT